MDSQDNEDRWLLCINPDDKGLYYYNPSTGKLSWDFPGTEFVFTPVINMAGDSPETNIRTTVETKHEFHSNDDDSLLAIKPKEMLYVYKVSDGWAYGQNVEGKLGYFPMSFVKPIKPPSGYDDLTERPYPLDFTPAMTPSHGKNSSSDSFNLDQSGYDYSVYVDSGYNTPVMKGQSNMAVTANTPISLFSALCSHLYSDLSTDIDIEEYDILKYSQTYFNRKGNKPRELTYNHKPINQSITPLSIDKERKAIEMNKNILLYMGDIKRNGIMNYYELRKVIVITAIRDDIVDELYCQIICQLLNNPSVDSINRGWELFVTIASMKKPSDLLLNYILSFLIKLYKIVGNIGSYAMFCIKLLLNYEKCDDVTMDKLDDILQIQLSSEGIFKCSIDEVLLLESNTQLLFQYNLLPYRDGRYGSNYEISPGYKYSTPFLSPDSIYKLITNGGFLLVVYGNNNNSNSSGIGSSSKGLRTKERKVYVTPQLDCITFYNPIKGTGSSQTIPLSTFCGVSYSKDDLLTHTTYNIHSNNNNNNNNNNSSMYNNNNNGGGSSVYDFNINDNNNNNNNNQFYRRRGSTHGASSEFEDKTFVLIGIEKDKSVQIVTDSLQERNRWILAFRCYFEWYNAIGRSISNDLSVNDLKMSFINYLRKILKDPNDFYRCLISGVPCTVTLFNSNNTASENYKHNGLMEITSDLQTINLKTAQQSIDLQIQYNEIKDVVLGLPDIKTTPNPTTTNTNTDNNNTATTTADNNNNNGDNTAASTPLNMSSSTNSTLNTTLNTSTTTTNNNNTSIIGSTTANSNTSLNKKKYKNNSFYIITKDESKSWCVTFSDRYTMNHYVYMLLSYLYWVQYRGDGIKDKPSNQISFENFIKEPLPQKPLSGTVPKFVLLLINRLKSMNVWSYQGIFRQSANNKSVDETCDIFNQGYYEQLDIIDNAYVVSVCLKKWLRDMSKPLIPDAFYEQVLRVATTDTPNGALSLVMSLPLYNKESLLYIMKFIKDLIRFSDMTGMKEEGMAIVFAPNICKISMRSKNTDLGEIKNFLVKLLGEIDYPPPEERLGNVPECSAS